jgi:hypothetical protein
MVDHGAMMSAFRDAMAKLAVLGQDTSNMIDCSDVIPTPQTLSGAAHYPAGSSYANIEHSVRVSESCMLYFAHHYAQCTAKPYPNLSTASK